MSHAIRRVVPLGNSANASITITDPGLRMIQRGAGIISGTYVGNIRGGIEASINGGAYELLDASPNGGVFSGSMNAGGRGTLSCRFIYEPQIVDTDADVNIGDIYVVMGDSNGAGRATSAAQAGASDVQYAQDGTWKAHQEAAVENTGTWAANASAVYPVLDNFSKGSMWGALAALLFTNTGIPAAFAPCAKGSTKAVNWAPNTSTSTLYGAALAHAKDLGDGTGTDHKALILLLGTNDVTATAAATFQTQYEAIVDGWFGHTGRPTVCCLISKQGVNGTDADGIRAAIQNVINSNANALQGPDFDGDWTNGTVHYLSTTDINTCAASASAALELLFH